MNVRLLKAMRRCCDDATHFATMRPVIFDGTLYATDRTIVVRYEEDAWRKGEVTFPTDAVALPDGALEGLKPGQEIGVSADGYVLPDGAVVGLDGIRPITNLGKICEEMCDDRRRRDHHRSIRCYSRDMLRRVLGVYEAAGIDPNVTNHLDCLEFDGYDARRGVWVRALVMGKV